MPSKDVHMLTCSQCGAKLKVVVTNGVWPMRMPETGECPKCGAEVIRKNVTGDITVELIER